MEWQKSAGNNTEAKKDSTRLAFRHRESNPVLPKNQSLNVQVRAVHRTPHPNYPSGCVPPHETTFSLRLPFTLVVELSGGLAILPNVFRNVPNKTSIP